jgi:hypothetical protein
MVEKGKRRRDERIEERDITGENGERHKEEKGRNEKEKRK